MLAGEETKQFDLGVIERPHAGRGGYFGEIAAIYGVPRMVDVVALTDLKLFKIKPSQLPTKVTA